MNAIAIIVLIAVSLESISASRRIVYKSPPPKISPVEVPSSNTPKKNNISNGCVTSNVPAIAENARKPVTKLPSSSMINQQLSNNELGKVPTNKPSRSLKGSASLNNVKGNANSDAIAKPKTSPKNSSASVPYLEKGKVIIVKGENGKVYVDDVFLFDFDDELKKGKFRFQVNAANDVLVNDRLVLRKRSEDALIIPINPNINEDGITKFEVRVDKYGYLHYTSNKGLSQIFAAGK